ncbi:MULTISPECIES: Hint domain-containing protein [unclassified Sinorhizobium]|uniref:Hint domain-containing protein n=1 Tax=unclassified Sinorhizobium TaxID=2613772 RepID=UPI00352374C5
MSSGAEQHSPGNRARRHFLGVMVAVGARVAAASSAAVTISSLSAQAKDKPKDKGPKDKPRGPKDRDPNCFLRGTAIMTPAGEVRIEDLRIGDRVETVSGKAMAIKWIGRRLYRKSGPCWQNGVMPIRIARHALDACMPQRDLYLSPSHALYIDGVLIRVKELVNGTSIAPALPAEGETIEYFNIALESHEVILAEGAPAETFLLRANNHENFTNFAEFERLRPVEAAPAMAPFAPVAGYEGGREHLGALLRLAAPRFIPVRDPVRDAYERIASRARTLVG